MTRILIETARDEEIELIRSFIQKHKLTAFEIQEDSKEIKAGNALEEAIRVLIPIMQ